MNQWPVYKLVKFAIVSQHIHPLISELSIVKALQPANALCLTENWLQIPYGWYSSRGIYFRVFLRVESHSRKLKLRKFCCQRVNGTSIHGLLGTIYRAANRSVSAGVSLTAIAEAIQEIEMLAT